MRIDMGNFGQAQRQVVSTQIDRGNPAEMAEAKINAARASGQAAAQAGRAWEQLGGQMQQVGGQMLQQVRQLAAQKSGLAIQQKQIHAQGVLQEAQDKVDTGELKSADVQKYVSDKMAAFKYDEIDGLDESGRMQLEKGLTAVDKSVEGSTNHLYRSAHKVESRASADEMISNNERLALNKDQDLDQAASLYDSPVFQAVAREGYGAGYKQRIIQAKNDLYAAGAKKAILDNRDSYSGLQAIGKEFEEGGRFHGKFDADTELALTGQIESRKGILEQKAAAAETRRQNELLRQQRIQQQNENQATNALGNAYEQIAAGYPLTDDGIEALNAKTQGTQAAGQMKVLIAANQAITQSGGGTFEERQRAIDAKNLELKQSGASKEDIQILGIQQRALDKQRTELKKDPIGTMAEQLRADVPPLDFSIIKREGTPAEQRASWQQFSEQLYQRKALSDQARQLDPSVPKALLTPDEKAQLSAELKSLPASQRVRMLASLQNGGGRLGPQLVKEVGASDIDNAAAYHINANPHVNTADLLVRGQEILGTKGNLYKAPDASKTAVVINDMYRDAIPVSQRNKLGPAIDSVYVALKADSGGDPNKFDKDLYVSAQRRVVGDVANYGAGKIVIPFGADANDIKNRLDKQVNALPDGANIRALISSGEAQLKAVGASQYMIVNQNGTAWAGQDNNPIYLTSQ